MKLVRDIQTVSDLKKNASRLIKQVNQTRHPVILTLNGKPAAVIQDVESYETMACAAGYELTVRAVQEALDYVEAGGKLAPAGEVFARISKRTGIDFGNRSFE